MSDCFNIKPEWMEHHRLAVESMGKLQKRTTQHGDQYGAWPVKVPNKGFVCVGYSLVSREMISQNYQPHQTEESALESLDVITHQEYFRHNPQVMG